MNYIPYVLPIFVFYVFNFSNLFHLHFTYRYHIPWFKSLKVYNFIYIYIYIYIYMFIAYTKKYLQSDWLRGVQY